MKTCIKYFLIFIPIFWVAYVFSQSRSSDYCHEQELLQKIRFDVNEMDENGMIGPPDGKRIMEYEFCIPLDKKKKKEVARIDPSVKFFKGPAGRSGCQGKYLCIGSGGTKETLLKLAKLGYIHVINACYYE